LPASGDLSNTCPQCAGPAGADDLVTVRLEVPVLEFTWDTSHETAHRATTSATVDAYFSQAADETSYHVAIDDAFLTHSGRSLASQFLWDAIHKGEIDPLELPLTVTYRSGTGEQLGEQAIDLLMLPDVHSVNGGELAGGDTPYIVVTRSAVQDVLSRWVHSFNGNVGYAVLLEVLATLLTVRENGTMLDDGEIPAVRERLGGLVDDGSRDAMIDWFTTNRDALTDIPLTIPSLDRLTVAGTVTIEAADGIQITGRDFAMLEVVADWRSAEDHLPEDLRWRFPVTTAVDHAKAAFTLATDRVVHIAGVDDPVRVRVLGADGATLWEQRYAPGDEQLATLAITVPHRVPIEITGPDQTPVDANLRLRGRVVVLDSAVRSRTCWSSSRLAIPRTASGAWSRRRLRTRPGTSGCPIRAASSSRRRPWCRSRRPNRSTSRSSRGRSRPPIAVSRLTSSIC
jgi:hypothetical protein